MGQYSEVFSLFKKLIPFHLKISTNESRMSHHKSRQGGVVKSLCYKQRRQKGAESQVLLTPTAVYPGKQGNTHLPEIHQHGRVPGDALPPSSGSRFPKESN